MLLESLRTHILTAGLKLTADHVFVFADDGRVEYHTAPNSLGWRRHFKATVLITNYAGDEALLEYHLMRWLDQHQPDRADDTALQFNIELLDHRHADVEITLQLSQRISVTQDDTGVSLNYCPESVPDGIEPPAGPVRVSIPTSTLPGTYQYPLPPYDVLTDISDDGLLAYYGYASPGTDPSQTAWRIVLIDLTNGETAEPQHPNGDDRFVFVWNDRAGYEYA